MKISDVLRFMEIEYGLRNDVDYSEDIKLEELDADWLNGMPSNEDFHISAPLCIEESKLQDKMAEKYMAYPNHIDWLLAITKQISLLSERSVICDEFLQLKNNLESIEEQYKD